SVWRGRAWALSATRFTRSSTRTSGSTPRRNRGTGTPSRARSGRLAIQHDRDAGNDPGGGGRLCDRGDDDVGAVHLQWGRVGGHRDHRDTHRVAPRPLRGHPALAAQPALSTRAVSPDGEGGSREPHAPAVARGRLACAVPGAPGTSGWAALAPPRVRGP